MRLWLPWVLTLMLSPSVVQAADSVLINELYYDAPGSDTGNEWIELSNPGGEAADLSGWKIERGGTSFSAVFTFPSGASIAPGSLLLIGESAVSGSAYTGSFAFQNGGDDTDGVRLVRPDGSVADVLLYDEPNTNGLPGSDTYAPDVAEGHSLARMGEHFEDSGTPTPGGANAAGSVSEGASPAATSSAAVASVADVFVNEVLPNPVGSDEEGEFIELWNGGGSTADLSEYFVDDEDGGSTPYELPPGTTIAAHGYLVVRRPDSKLAFNNDADRARLLRPDTSVLHELTYDDVPSGEGHAWARKSDGSAAWTTTPTPGNTNAFSAAAVSPTAPQRPTPSPSASPRAVAGTSPTPAVRGTSTATRQEATSLRQASLSGRQGFGRQVGNSEEVASSQQTSSSVSPAASAAPEPIALADLRSLPLGTRVRVRGIVSAAPGIFDDRLLYLAGSGIGVVLTDGTFPSYAVGDTLEVTGVTAEPRHERLLAVASPADVVQQSSGDAPAPHEAKSGEIGETLEGSLVRLQATIVRIEGRTIVVNDGSGDARIAFTDTFGEPPSLTVGTDITIIGIVSEDDHGHRVLPRSVEDIVVEGKDGARRPFWKQPLVAIVGLVVLAAGGWALKQKTFKV